MKVIYITVTASLFVASSLLFTGGSSCFISPCPSYWTYFNGSCYRIFSAKKTWEDAEEFCKNIGAPNGEGITHLASIHSQDEQDFIYIHWSTHRDHTNPNIPEIPYPSLWIGLNELAEPRTWVWTDGSDVDQTFWYPGSPDYVGGHSDGAANMKDGAGHNGLWHDARHDSSDKTFPFICKTPAITCATDYCTLN